MTALDRLDAKLFDATRDLCPLEAFGWAALLTGTALIAGAGTAGAALYLWGDLL